MPYATDRKDKMFTAYNLNTLYSRFDAKCRAALNEMGPLWAQSRFSPFDQWSAPFPYGVWYVYRNDPETAMRLHDDGGVPDPSIPGIGYYRDEHNQVAAQIAMRERHHVERLVGEQRQWHAEGLVTLSSGDRALDEALPEELEDAVVGGAGELHPGVEREQCLGRVLPEVRGRQVAPGEHGGRRGEGH